MKWHVFLKWLNLICWSFYVQHTDIIKSAKEVREIWNQQGITGRGLACVQLVYGIAGQWIIIVNLCSICFKCVFFILTGVGKSHYIRQQLVNSSCSVTIAVSEGFEPLKSIQRLNALPKQQRNCAIYFNFNFIPPVGVSMERCYSYLIIHKDLGSQW